jgi:hypothetical protein
MISPEIIVGERVVVIEPPAVWPEGYTDTSEPPHIIVGQEYTVSEIVHHPSWLPHVFGVRLVEIVCPEVAPGFEDTFAICRFLPAIPHEADDHVGAR